MFKNLLVALNYFVVEVKCLESSNNNMFSEFLQMVQNEDMHKMHHYHPEVFSHD